jgi:hypothetical protein
MATGTVSRTVRDSQTAARSIVEHRRLVRLRGLTGEADRLVAAATSNDSLSIF